MLTKEEYLAKLKTQLDEWQEDLTALRAKAAEVSEDAREGVEAQIAELKTKWDEGAEARQKVLDAADDKWEEVKDEAEEKWEELKVGVKDAVERIKGLFG